MYVSVGLNIGLSPQHGLCQLFRPHPKSRNSYSSDKTTAQLLYVHRRVGEKLKQRTTTSISDASTLSTQF